MIFSIGESTVMKDILEYIVDFVSFSEFTKCYLHVNNVLKFIQAPLLYGLLVSEQYGQIKLS